MNDTQRRLVENNHNLIYTFLERKDLNENAVEDWYGVAATGLCRAGMSYDETKGTRFSTLAFVCMENEYKMAIRHANSSSVTGVLSLNGEVDGQDGTEFMNTIIDELDYEELASVNTEVHSVLETLSDRDRAAMELVLEGKRLLDVAGYCGCSRSTVSYILKKFREEMYDRLEERVAAYFKEPQMQ